MKRFVALLLVFSMMIPLVGCSITKEDLKDAAVEIGKEIVGDVAEDLKEDFEQKKDELIGDLPQLPQTGEESTETPQLPQTGEESTETPQLPQTGEQNNQGILDACKHTTPKKYNEKTNKIICECGGPYPKTVNFANFKLLVSPYTFWHSVFLGISEDDYYLEKYATYLGEAACSVFSGSVANHEYVFEEEDCVIQCKYCSSVYPAEELVYSVFLEFFFPKKNLAGLSRTEKLSKLSEKEKTKAVNSYLKTKTMIAAIEFESGTSSGKLSKGENPDVILALGAAVSKYQETWKTVTLQNSTTFSMVYTYLPKGFDAAGVDAPFLDDLSNHDLGLSVIEMFTAAYTAHTYAEAYEKESEKLIKNTYKINKAFIEMAIHNAKSLAAVAGLLSNFEISVGAPVPNVDQLLAQVEELAETYTLRQVYQVLSRDLISDNQYTVNDLMGKKSIPKERQFKEINTYTAENIKNAMKAGPTAREMAGVIDYIVQSTDSVKSSDRVSWKATVESALWYYHGWRVEYEAEQFLQMIYLDEV